MFEAQVWDEDEVDEEPRAQLVEFAVEEVVLAVSRPKVEPEWCPEVDDEASKILVLVQFLGRCGLR